MSAYRDILALVGDITPEDRQALIICLVNLTGPAKFPLTSDYGAGGLFSKVTGELSRVADAKVRTQLTAELLKWLSEEHCRWMLIPQPVKQDA